MSDTAMREKMMAHPVKPDAKEEDNARHPQARRLNNRRFIGPIGSGLLAISAFFGFAHHANPKAVEGIPIVGTVGTVADAVGSTALDIAGTGLGKARAFNEGFSTDYRLNRTYEKATLDLSRAVFQKNFIAEEGTQNAIDKSLIRTINGQPITDSDRARKILLDNPSFFFNPKLGREALVIMIGLEGYPDPVRAFVQPRQDALDENPAVTREGEPKNVYLPFGESGDPGEFNKIIGREPSNP